MLSLPAVHIQQMLGEGMTCSEDQVVLAGLDFPDIVRHRMNPFAGVGELY